MVRGKEVVRGIRQIIENLLAAEVTMLRRRQHIAFHGTTINKLVSPTSKTARPLRAGLFLIHLGR